VVLLFRLSRSGLALSTVGVFEILPVLMVAPFVGVVMDRLSRRAMLFASNIACALLMLGLIAATETCQVSIVAALLRTAKVFFNPTVA
jgi:uncharacterized protein YqgC (DUF456 family)